ncbi:hypothetical protein MML48_10g00000193 [Holotrichia oblita]|uniref:Uncharacterized protein n=1 Tax=Holotrichia oblita TaxID=644536 RepID=A0ACB9SFM0_HOLOL|nr:hypothetical protein MML48_10g00000193 [Holotrichia oblita]
MFPTYVEAVRRQRRHAQRTLRENMRYLRDASNPFGLPEATFIQLFRLNMGMVQYLFESLRETMVQNTRVTRVSYQQRILIALRFLASGTYQRGIGQEYILSVSQQVVSRCIVQVTTAIQNTLAARWIQFPVTDNAQNEKKEIFMRERGFPGVVGAIDCTHVAIIAPTIEEHNYLNRKGFHSKNVQVICDHHLKILNINSNFTGNAHDSYIWRNSTIKTLSVFVELCGKMY